MSDFRAVGDSGLLRFHRSLYFSLALSCACLVYAEWAFLPEMTVIAVLAGAALFTAYRVEGRWSLSLRAANVVGGVIGVVVMGWIALQIVRPSGTLLKYLPWPASLLPYLGPLVLVIIPAKLFRPKHVGDYWGLQFAGLMGVGLASALGGDSIICVMTLVYACAATRCLLDFHAVADRVQSPRATKPDEPIGPGFWRTAAMTMPIAVAAMVLSMVMPRVTDAKWEYGNLANRLQTGYSDDRPAIDLNMSGELNVSDEEAFTIRVETANGRPKLDLSPAQRWRGTTFNFYDRGKWQNRNWASYGDQRRMGRLVLPDAGPIVPFVRPRTPRRGEQGQGLPDLGPDQFIVTFPYPIKLHQSFFLAEPVWAPLGEREGRMYRAPVETIGARDVRHGWVAQQEGDVFPPVVSSLPLHPEYRQVVAPLPEVDIGLPVFIDPALAEHLTIVSRLSRLRQFSDELLRDLIAKGRLTWSGDPPATGKKAPDELHERIARAFDSYLRSSGDFRYSFTLDRNDVELDPIEDFVLNIRQGHCNRFSSALALLLRCQGVPTRVVMGFHGAESLGNGKYVVRHNHAHSWVEAAIRRPAGNGATSWHWLTLDPTPESPSLGDSGSLLSQFVDSILDSGSSFIRNYVLDYNADRQRSLGDWFLSFDPREWSGKTIVQVSSVSFAAIAGLLSLRWLIRHRRRQSGYGDHAYGTLLELIRKSGCMIPNTSWTPNELVEQLRRRTPIGDAAEAAERIVARHYAERFGGELTSGSSSDDLTIVCRHLAGWPRDSDVDSNP